MLMEIVSMYFSILVITFMPRMWKSAWLINLTYIIVVDKLQVLEFQTKEDKRNTLALPLTKPIMGCNRDGYNGARHSVIEFTNKT